MCIRDRPLRVQGCYASDEEIENVTGYIKKSYQSDYDETVVEQIEKIDRVIFCVIKLTEASCTPSIFLMASSIFLAQLAQSKS